ncbi:MAG: deoxyribose-phosphate aldolase [Clostridia bacterium]
MEKNKILEHVDHTLLSQTAVWKEIQQLCEEAIQYKTASICIPPSFVKRAKEFAGNKMKICTVIGFPQGYATTATKLFETKDALQNGADEIDMVINLGDLKAGEYDKIEQEICLLKEACGQKILKVIIETCLLTDEEIVEMCQVVMRAHADYIKTSTGCSTGGANPHVVGIMGQTIKAPTKIKASGGIQSFADAETYLSLGASRLGTSRLVKIQKSENA